MGWSDAAGGSQDVDLLADPSAKISGASGDDMGIATGTMIAIGLGAGQAASSIYGSKKAASVQREGMAQAQKNLDRGRADAAKAYEAWQVSQAPVFRARKAALHARMRAMGIDPGDAEVSGAATAPGAESPAVMASVREAPPPQMFGPQAGGVPPPETMGGMVPGGFTPPAPTGGPGGPPVPMETAELITGPAAPVPVPGPVGVPQPGMAPPVPQDYMPPTMGGLYG
jgi:hypothetical protein